MTPRLPKSDHFLDSQLARKADPELALLLQSESERLVRSAARALVQRHLRSIQRECEHRVRGNRFQSEAEDLSQQASLRFYLRLISGQPVDSPAGLAIKIARNTVATFYQAHPRRVTPSATISTLREIRDPLANTAEDVLARLEFLRLVEELGARYGLLLCDALLGRSSRQSAAQLGTTEVTVDTDRFRMRKAASKEYER